MLICAGQGKLVYSGSLLSPVLCGIMWIGVMCPPPKPLTPPPPPTQANLESVYKQSYRGMNLDGGDQKDLHTANSVISGCQMI